MAGFWARLLGRKPNNLPPYDFKRSPWRTRKPWPPNLSNMTEKQQFRFERKFKRRIKLKSLRPKLNQYIKITQWSLISFVVVYGVLFHDFAQDPMNPRPGEQPFKGIREKMWNFLGGFWSHTDGSMQDARGAQRLEPLRGRQIDDGSEQRETSRPR